MICYPLTTTPLTFHLPNNTACVQGLAKLSKAWWGLGKAWQGLGKAWKGKPRLGEPRQGLVTLGES